MRYFEDNNADDGDDDIIYYNQINQSINQSIKCLPIDLKTEPDGGSTQQIHAKEPTDTCIRIHKAES